MCAEPPLVDSKVKPNDIGSKNIHEVSLEEINNWITVYDPRLHNRLVYRFTHPVLLVMVYISYI